MIKTKSYSITVIFLLILFTGQIGAASDATIQGTVTDNISKKPVVGATIRTNGDVSGLTDADGNYYMSHHPGTFTIIVEADGYESERLDNISVRINEITHLDFILSPLEKIYKFERMWPIREPAWSFGQPFGVASDNSGFVYVADSQNDRIIKLSKNGRFISKWGKEGQGDGEFSQPYDIAVDSNGFVYVTDSDNNRIQKFSPDGKFHSKWGKEGQADGELKSPHGIAVSLNGDILYVADMGNNRVQKFSSDGEFIGKWGIKGLENGQFDQPYGIALDNKGFVYVADSQNNRIQKFNSDGDFIGKWGNEQLNRPYGIDVDRHDIVYVTDMSNNRIRKYSSNGQVLDWQDNGHGFDQPHGIAVTDDYIYVADTNNHRIQKLGKDGRLLERWGTDSIDGDFSKPDSIAIHSDNVYVADTGNNRIQKFSTDGEFLGKWGSKGTGRSEFDGPYSIAVNADYVYVADTKNNRIQQFNRDGEFVDKWGTLGHEDGEFDMPHGIAVGPGGIVYVADTNNHQIQVFKANGEFLDRWGSKGTGNKEFDTPYGIAVSPDNKIYVADTRNHCIQVFDANGGFLGKWGTEGTGETEFRFPEDIVVDSTGYVYVTDKENSRIQKFDSNGTFLMQWGKEGSYPGQMKFPGAGAVDSEGNFYIADTNNHRIQKFKISIKTNDKAIIVAGGGPYIGNALWDATQMSASFAYWTLNYQGFTKDSIHYLSPDTDLDLDDDDLPDVDGDASNKNIQEAIKNWAQDAGHLVLYLVDHGGKELFRVSKTETLSASDLDLWLDSLPVKVTLIYDACYAGSFLPLLTPPESGERIVISSTSANEEAYFINHGDISFSKFFWTNILNGTNVKKAFDLAETSVGKTSSLQHPLLDDNGDGVYQEDEDGNLAQNTYIGNGIPNTYTDAPKIGSVKADLVGTNTFHIHASGVTDKEGVARVWAVIKPPGHAQGTLNNAVLELPSVNLLPVGGDQYEGAYDKFNHKGTYYIAIYASDKLGNVSNTILTVSPDNPMRRKAIIMAGTYISDPLLPAIEKNVTQAYRALTLQGYGVDEQNDDICIMSPKAISEAWKELPSLEGLRNAIVNWASISTEDVVIYLEGNSEDGKFQINETETLEPADLNKWLNELQTRIPGKVTIVIDALASGNYIEALTPEQGKERILITSTSRDTGSFLFQEDISFSSYFWKEILNGVNVRDAFQTAKNAVEFLSSHQQHPVLDDNGNGIGNEDSDGLVSRYYTIGMGLEIADEGLFIGTVSPELELDGINEATIWVDNITSTRNIEAVWAVITPPGYGYSGLSQKILELLGEGRYENTYNGFSSFGNYRIAVSARDKDGNTSLLKETKIYQADGPDIYEEDDDSSEANVIIIGEENPGISYEIVQHHNFYDTDDADWVKFYGIKDVVYRIEARNLGEKCNIVIELYDADINKLPDKIVTSGDPPNAYVSYDWTCPNDGLYYLEIKNTGDYGKNTDYYLQIYKPTAPPNNGTIWGFITDADNNKNGIAGILIKTDANCATVSTKTGAYELQHPPGNFMITATDAGYRTESSEIHVPSGGEVIKDFVLNKCVIKGVIQDRYSYSPINGAAIKINDTYSTSTLVDGKYAIPYEPGELTVTVEACDYESESSDVTHSCETTKNFDLVKCDPAIKGIIKDACSKKPVKDATIIVNKGSTKSEGDGSYSFTLNSGTYTITIEAFEYNTRIEEIEILPCICEVSLVDFELVKHSSYTLDDIILILQAMTMPEMNVSHDKDINGDDRIGLQDVIYIIQEIAGLRCNP